VLSSYACDLNDSNKGNNILTEFYLFLELSVTTTFSINFWITWLPFWSVDNLFKFSLVKIDFANSNFNVAGSTSKAFCIALQPYALVDIFAAWYPNTVVNNTCCSLLQNSNNFWTE